MPRTPRRFVFTLAATAFLALAARPALAQPLVQLGSAGDRDGIESEFIVGLGYEIDMLTMPFTVGVLAQSGAGIEGDDGRQFPLRAYLTGKFGMIPTPGFRVYVGAGAGASTRIGGGAEGARNFSGMALAGIGGGLLHLEVQLQRDFAEEPITRWVTAIGLSF